MRLEMAVTVNVGHSVNMTIAYLDANGNPMLTPPTPDTPPTWTNTSTSVGTLTVAGGGLTATELAIAPGSDVVNLSLTVDNVAFSATLAVTVDAAPQVLTSIQIVPAVV